MNYVKHRIGIGHLSTDKRLSLLLIILGIACGFSLIGAAFAIAGLDILAYVFIGVTGLVFVTLAVTGVSIGIHKVYRVLVHGEGIDW